MSEEHHRDASRAKNEAIFRQVNERLREINLNFAVILPLSEWVCECADLTCIERLPIDFDEYDAIRASAARYAVAPEHVNTRAEHVIERYPNYWVVEKFGEGVETSD